MSYLKSRDLNYCQAACWISIVVSPSPVVIPEVPLELPACALAAAAALDAWFALHRRRPAIAAPEYLPQHSSSVPAYAAHHA
jgi:hypothetical protein